MSHDLKELRAALTAHAAEPEFTISSEGVRQRAGQQRTRRSVMVAGIAVLAVLAIAAPAGLLKSAGLWSNPAASDGLRLPDPGPSWRIVDDPIRTGLPSDGGGPVELVLWFTVSDQGAVSLREGVLHRATDKVVEIVPDGGQGVPKEHLRGTWMPTKSWSSEGEGHGLFVGDAARIEFVTPVGYLKEGERSVYPASMRRLSTHPNVIAFWADLPSEDENRAGEDAVVDFGIRAYDANGAILKEDRPWVPAVPRPPDADPVKAPQRGTLIRTGEFTTHGEVVVSFHGEGADVGAVIAQRDPRTGQHRDKVAPEDSWRPEFEAGLSGWRSEYPLVNGNRMALGMAVGQFARITATLDGRSYPVKTATWSEDPEVRIWWVVAPKGVSVSEIQIDLYDGSGTRLDGAPDGPHS
ncbi:MAG: hypothetical protein ACRDT6_20950 [Micromonosporaceae bacterium]